MGLSRLENFLRSIRGNIIYVDPNSLDATDSIENTGSALTRPFKTIQRALIEAARFSYLPGSNNDRFGNTTILVYPGEHLIDNRPGWIPVSNTSFRLRNGQTSSDFYEFDAQTNFDITTDNNALYKFNSIHGGVIVPRGTSIVGLDLRKTKIRPKYVPNPENDNIERCSIFQLTGACYLWQLSIFDGNPNGQVYKDYTNNTFVPNFSHHKLTTFSYADGVNNINIDDDFQTYSTTRTDLDIYYQKIGLAYGPSSGRNITPDYPNTTDIETKIDEFRIVGSRGAEIGISSIRSGDGVTASNTITVTLESELEGLAVDTPIRINGVTGSGYNGQFVVKTINSPTEIEYSTSNIPTNAIGGSGGTLNITVDTVTSASPYIFNCSLRSVYGMCGLHADGSLVDGFKSMVVAQFTGISLQKDNNAFVKYDPQTGTYLDTTNVENIYSDSLARYKPTYESYHIKASNNAFIQCVSIFAIGFSNQFEADSGGDMSITNSNSNFGARALVSKGFREDKFSRDDVGYISHIVPPKHIDNSNITIEFDSIDISKTVSVANNSRLYLYNQTSEFSSPVNVIDGYRIGAKLNDTLNVIINTAGISSTYSAKVVMSGNDEITYEKSYAVAKVGNTQSNDIVSSVINLTEDHDFQSGETVRIISDTGHLPDGLSSDKVYYVIASDVDGGLSSTEIKLSSSLNDAINGSTSVNIYSNEISNLRVVSRVSDKNSGDIGHPIQFDSTENQWYINAESGNNIYSTILTSSLLVSPRTYFIRTPDTRSLEDTLYKFRYVIPKDSETKARPPLDGFIIQESTDLPLTNDEIGYQYSPTLTTKQLDNSNQLRKTRFIASASWSSSTVTIRTELPHNLSIGSEVQINQVLSGNNPTGISTSGYNGYYVVASTPSSKEFTYSLSSDPGLFIDNTSVRTNDLPYYNRKSYNGVYYIYRSKQVQEYIEDQQDGIYHLTILNSSNNPNVSPYTGFRLSQPVQNLYPQLDRDNPVEDPDSSTSFAVRDPIGQVVIDDPQKSLTKETLNNFLLDSKRGYKLTNITSSGSDHIFYTDVDHGLNPASKLTITSPGFGYGTTGTPETLFNARLVGFAGSTTGENATAVVRINASGEITNIEIMDGGSAYGIGNTLSVVGLATTNAYVPAVVTVSQIYDHIGETVRLTGISSDFYSEYNNLYRITGINSSRYINVESLLPTSSSSVPAGLLADSNAYLTGRSLESESSRYTDASGKSIILSGSQYDPFIKLGQKIRTIDSSNQYRDFVVTNINPSNPSDLTIESADNNVDEFITLNNYKILPYGYSSEYGDNLGIIEDRIIPEYAGITTTISSPISITSNFLSISNVDNQGLKIGDYIEVDDEVMRIRETVNGNPIRVIRGALGTKNAAHSSGTSVRKINPFAIEFRRNSILRASGHTFEYVGFGPGNYSNSLPERQDRQITDQEELLSQSFKLSGGINVYTGMNNDGDFYIGNKRVNSATGTEDVFDSPVPTIRGEELDIESGGAINIIGTQEVNISRSIRVEGGSKGDIVSEFNGPVVFNDKITSNSPRGIEGNSLFLQGGAVVSRKYTVGIATPFIAGNSGDVEFYSEPPDGGSIGWVYTTGNTWREFGPIKNADGRYVGLWSGTFYGDGSQLTGISWVVDPIGIHTTGNVGIGTTLAISEYQLYVNGNVNIGGTYYEKGIPVINSIKSTTIVYSLLFG